jgi:hypothetical protein
LSGGGRHRQNRVIMREHDLVRLERELAIHLPRQYREFMIAYPFPRSSWAGDFGTPDDVDLLLDLNREKRQLPSSVLSGDAFFIGSDGKEADYFIRLSDLSCGVAVYDTGTHQVSTLAKTFEDCLSQLRVANEADTISQRAVRKWWQVWK